jgi:hypothetical protein
MLQQILRRLDALEQEVDHVDRRQRPYGDGTRLPRPRRIQ